MASRLVIGGIAAIACLGAAASARADGGIWPRTPALWPDDTPCMTVVDRSQSAVLQFTYRIGHEDTHVEPEELPGSRRHQFVGLCRADPYWWLPAWISQADVAAWNAWELGLGYPSTAVDPEDVLETSSEYGDCFARITADDARRPITFAAADEPVAWDTTGLPAGGYVLRGYTWHPPFNVWSRPRVVHVVDGPDPATAPPAVGLSLTDDFFFADEGLTMTGCARAEPGSTLRAYWAAEPHDGVSYEWNAFVEQPLVGETFALTFLPPPEAITETVLLRVDVTDPQQRTFSAHSDLLVVVLPGQEPDCYNSFLSCMDSETGASPTTGGDDSGALPTSTGATDGDSAGGQTGEPAGGCGCATAANGGGWALAGLLALMRRRRLRGMAGGAENKMSRETAAHRGELRAASERATNDAGPRSRARSDVRSVRA
jgi:MYXO-CTERM domain-containing protein